jgi:hypothetical protein
MTGTHMLTIVQWDYGLTKGVCPRAWPNLKPLHPIVLHCSIRVYENSRTLYRCKQMEITPRWTVKNSVEKNLNTQEFTWNCKTRKGGMVLA